MEYIGKLELRLASWYGRLPHLPDKARRWIADNIWWMVVVGVVLMALGLLSILGVLLVGTMLLSVFAGVYGVILGSLVALLVLVWIVLYVVDIVMLAMAVSPLKAHLARGWRLLFVVLSIGVVVEVAYVFVSTDVGGFVSSLVSMAIGGYVLFEIRNLFGADAVVHTPQSEG